MIVDSDFRTSFVLVQASWSAARALEIVTAVQATQVVVDRAEDSPLEVDISDPATHVVVHREEGTEEYYYLFDGADFRTMLEHAPFEMDVRQALDLHEGDRSAVRDRSELVASVGAPTVVVDDGAVVGFVEPLAPMPPTPGTRSGQRSRSRRRSRSRAAPRRRDLGGEVPRSPGAGEAEEPAASMPMKLTSDFPEQVHLDSVTSLLVELAGPDASGPGLDLDLEPGSSLDIRVQARSGFEVDGPTDHRIEVSAGNSLPVQFRLRATALGRGTIRVFAFMDGLALGAIDLAPVVVAENESTSSATIERDATMALITVVPPDLAMVVFETVVNGKPAFEARLTDKTGRLNWKSFGPVELRSDPAAFFDDFFGDIEKMPLGTDAQRAHARRHLAAKGLSLYEEVVPADLRDELWRLRGQISTVQIQSEEPWIPWELCKLSSTEDGMVVEGGHLCEEFAVTRWLLEVPRQSKLTLGNMAIVVPDDSNLAFARDERNFMLGLAGAGRSVSSVAATAADVRRGLASGAFDAWHFSGHGGFRNPNPNRSAMVLQSGDELTPEDLSGVVANLGRSSPLVFLNACQIGRSAMGLTGVGGWASKFLQAGAGAFVGAYWSVYDDAANKFAQTFYTELVGGRPIAAATQTARDAIKRAGDPTWLAYTVFSEPSLTVAS